MNEFSFKKGYGQVQKKDLHDVRRKLMTALNIKNRVSFNKRMNGDIEPKISEAKAVEAVFLEYGIIQVWGDQS